MSNLQAFFMQNVDKEVTEEFIVSKRFKDPEGNPVPWKLRTISESENKEIRQSATKRTKVKGQFVNEIDPEDYAHKLVVKSVVYPDLKSAELQKSYGVMGEEDLLRAMLISGEYGRLTQKVQELNGFSEDINDLVEEVKN